MLENWPEYASTAGVVQWSARFVVEAEEIDYLAIRLEVLLSHYASIRRDLSSNLSARNFLRES